MSIMAKTAKIFIMKKSEKTFERRDENNRVVLNGDGGLAADQGSCST